jgi:prephenate dehydrogenase
MRTALIAGLGLIGGAVGMALRARGWRVHFLDPHVSLDDAQRAGAADVRVESFGDADVIILATPIDVAVEQLRALDAPLVTSVCGVMQPLRDVARNTFVAGHPMAGWHEGGLANAHRVQLAGASWFLDADYPLVEELVRDCGAKSVHVDAAQHDAAVALTSHLPQVLSTALFAHLADQSDVEAFAGPGLKSFRLAGSEGDVWRPLLAANRERIAPHADAVAELVRAIIAGEDDDAFAKARALWQRLQS